MSDLHGDTPSPDLMLPTKAGVGVQIPAVVFDLDGVLCDSAGDMFEAIEEAKGDTNAIDWLEWNKGDFDVIPEYVTLAMILANADVAVIILTARQEPSREVTTKWLEANGVPCDELLMRPMDHDYHTWKADAIRALLSSPYDVQLVLDDSYHHCESMRPFTPVIQVRNVASHLQ
jgi:hypothetical protein